MSYLSSEMLVALEKIQSNLINVGDNLNINETMGCTSCTGGCSGGCDGCSGGCQGGCTGCSGSCYGTAKG